jgi:hypothetical protein
VIEEAAKEEKILAQEKAALAYVMKSGLNNYYSSAKDRYGEWKSQWNLNGTTPFQFSAKINTTQENSTLFVIGQQADWGALWPTSETAENDFTGYTKGLFIRNGRLVWRIGYSGRELEDTNSVLNDGQDHIIGVKYNNTDGHYCLIVDGQPTTCGLDDNVEYGGKANE